MNYKPQFSKCFIVVVIGVDYTRISEYNKETEQSEIIEIENNICNNNNDKKQNKESYIRFRVNLKQLYRSVSLIA